MNGVVGFVKSLTYGNLINYLVKRLCNCLSMKDSYDCYRNCMRIRLIETYRLIYLIECDGMIEILNICH